MIRRKLLFTALAVLSVVAIRLASAQEQVKAPDQEKAQERGDYRIGPEDVLNIVVWNNTAMSMVVPVRPDGMISLPLLNDVQAEGRTPMELRDILKKRLVEYIPAPEVSVIVNDVKSFNVTVIGEVGKVGRLNLRSRTTVLDALAQSGGFNNFASRSRIVVLRPEGKTFKRIPFNYNKAVGDSREQENLFLQPGDIIMVP